MATITASLERSFQNCSLNQTTRNRRGSGGGAGGLGRSSSSDSPETINHHHHQLHHQNHHNQNQYSGSRRPTTKDDCVTHSNASSSDNNSTFVELNSHVSLPYRWEQCLDLKTGEIYYINWSNGMKAKEDPRTTVTGYNGDYSSEEEEEEEEESNCYDSEGSSSESSPCSSTRKESFRSMTKQQQLSQDAVLVVAGCQSCFMYFMVPKNVKDCHKCSGQLLRFAASNNNTSSP